MALSGTPNARASTWHTVIYPPLANSDVESGDVASGEELLGNSDQYLYDTKVNRAGDTMTNSLVITVSTLNGTALTATGNGTGGGIVGSGGLSGGIGGSFLAQGGNAAGVFGTGNGSGVGVSGLGGATGSGGQFIAGGGNKYGVEATGNGTASGVFATGGATGTGVIATAGGGNGHGVAATGAGTGSGITCTGGTTGPGITATNGTAQTDTAPTCAGTFAGYIEITGADPIQGVPPGASNRFYALSGCKSYCQVEVGAGGPYTRDDSHNVASVVDVATGIYEVAFLQNMASAAYSVVLSTSTVGLGVSWSDKTASGFRFHVYDTNTKAEVATVTTVDFQVFGRK